MMDYNMFKGFSGSTFCGLQNYIDAFHNEYFQVGLKNNILLMLVAVPILLILSIIIATLLNQKIFARGALRAAFFMPYVTTITAAALVFSALFQPWNTECSRLDWRYKMGTSFNWYFLDLEKYRILCSYLFSWTSRNFSILL